MNSHQVLATIRDELSNNVHERERLQREADALRLTIDILSRGQRRSPARQAKPKKKRRSPKQPSMGVTTADVDMTGAETQIEQITRIAKAAPNGEVNTIQMVDLLVEVGLADESKREALRSSLYRHMKRHPDFLVIRRGWFRYSTEQDELDTDEHPADASAKKGHEDCDDGDDCDILLDLFGRP